MSDACDKYVPGATWLGVVRHPSTGIRMPELFLPGILSAYRMRNVAGTLSLSFGRETAPTQVIQAKPGLWEITRGHTGTSIREYMSKGAQAAQRAGVAVELEADHLIITGAHASALRRLAGHHEHHQITPQEVLKSLDYYRMCIDEAAQVGGVACFTIDASGLYWRPARRLARDAVEDLFAQRFSPDEASAMLGRYHKRFRFSAPGGREVRVFISRLQAMRLALMFRTSLEASKRVYDYCRQALGNRPFSWEIALDETPQVTAPRETLWYLTEWKAMGLPCHYLGPNLGFAKRVDYEGDLGLLERRVRQQHAIARGVAGALLSIHSGDGANPYSGKGLGVYEAILAGTGGNVKFKISDVYYELLMEMLGPLPPRSEGRKLYERIFDEVEGFVRHEVATRGALITPLLVKQLDEYDEDIRRDLALRRHPRTQFFRFNAFLALNMRDASGKRYLREALIRYVKRDVDFRARFNQEVEALTLRLIDGLQLANNLA